MAATTQTGYVDGCVQAWGEYTSNPILISSFLFRAGVIPLHPVLPAQLSIYLVCVVFGTVTIFTSLYIVENVSYTCNI